MKRKVHFLALAFALVVSITAYAQTSTKGFSFQGYAIDPDGKSLSSTGVTVKFTLSSVSNAGTPFEEEHALTTDAFGVFHAIIGNSTVAKNIEFSKLNFTKKGDESYTLKVEVKKTSGGTYTTISNEPLNAVPYARVAENGVPVGTIVAFAGPISNMPAGWLNCDGTAYSSTDYPQLFAAIGTAWGDGSSGTNTTTGDFNVPDTRGEFLRGVAQGYTARDPDVATRYQNMAGGNTGDAVGSTQWSATARPGTAFTVNTASSGAHTHHFYDAYYAENRGAGFPNNLQGSGGGQDGDNSYFERDNDVWSAGDHIHSIDNTTWGGGDSQTRPINVYVYYIIKY